MRLAPLLALVLVAVGCTSGKQDAASLATAVDRYRKASLDAKKPLVDALEAVPCSDEDVCAAKSACLAAARPTVKGMALMAEVRLALDAVDAGTLGVPEAASRGLPGKLDEASRLLEEGKSRVGECDARVLALKSRYGL
ncbi:MAG TPA: hypothetical protein VIF09_11180 [Polyangiaceae bacterium]|jgi:hypothetical protein